VMPSARTEGTIGAHRRPQSTQKPVSLEHAPPLVHPRTALLIPPRLGSDPLDPAADEWKADQSSALAASSNRSGLRSTV
jgi:hypothetical protein